MWLTGTVPKLFSCSDKIQQGGGVAAPIASQVLGEVLPYLEVSKNEENATTSVEMPNLIGLTAVEAKKEIKKLGLEADIKNNTGEEIDIQNAVITDQLPKQGIRINARNKSNTVYRITAKTLRPLWQYCTDYRI